MTSEKTYEQFLSERKAEDPLYDLDIWQEDQIIKRINKMIGELHKCARAVGRNPMNKPLRWNMTLYFKALDARQTQTQVPDPEQIPERLDELDGGIT